MRIPMIAVMADHGEALGEHGESTHGIFLYDETSMSHCWFQNCLAEVSRGRQVESRVAWLMCSLPILQRLGRDSPRST